MEIDLPEVVAEVTAAFERYEQALVTNDVATLDALFRDDPRTIRYGGGENLYGYRGDPRRSARARSPAGLTRTLVADRHHHLRPRLRGRHRRCSTAKRARQGRTADADLGALSGRLARRRRACQRHR